jgi:hypothetical protein
MRIAGFASLGGIAGERFANEHFYNRRHIVKDEAVMVGTCGCTDVLRG